MKYFKTLVTILVAVAIVLVVKRYVGYSNLPVGQPKGGESTVVAEKVEDRSFVTRIEALGTAHANESVTITSSVSERVGKVFFENGETVKAGDLLVQLENAEELADLEQAKVNLQEQRRELERLKPLRNTKVISQQDYDTRQSAVKTAEAQVAAAMARLEDLAITAPFSGVLGLRQVSPGALVQPGTQIATLDDLDVIKVNFTIPETLLGEINVDQKIEAGSVAYADETFHGVVTSIDSRVDATTRAVTLQAKIDNPDHRLRPGMLMTIVLIVRQHDAAGVPEKALLAYGEKHFAYVLKSDQTVERREVNIGQRETGWVEIKEGLNAGETIVVEGLMSLKDGARVRVAEASVAKDDSTKPSPIKPE